MSFTSFPTQIFACMDIRTCSHTHTQTSKPHVAACTLAHARHLEYRGEKSGLKKALQQKTWHVPPSCIHWVQYSFRLMSLCEFGAGCVCGVRVGVYVEACVCVCALQLKRKSKFSSECIFSVNSTFLIWTCCSNIIAKHILEFVFLKILSYWNNVVNFLDFFLHMIFALQTLCL